MTYVRWREVNIYHGHTDHDCVCDVGTIQQVVGFVRVYDSGVTKLFVRRNDTLGYVDHGEWTDISLDDAKATLISLIRLERT